METKQDVSAILTSLLSNLPDSLQSVRKELSCHLHQNLQLLLSKCELVTRDEFDAQVRVLARTRARMAALEKQLQDDGKGKSVSPIPPRTT